MKKRRSNAIIRNKLFAMIMASVSDTHRMWCHMKREKKAANECVTVSQMLSDYIIARFDRRGRSVCFPFIRTQQIST